MSWIVVQAHSLSEQRVAERLRHRNIESYCPTYEREIRHARYVSIKRYPQFSRYVFANVDLTRRHWVRDIDVRGAVGFVPAAMGHLEVKMPGVVPDNVIKLIGYVELRDVLSPGECVLLKQWGVEGLFSEMIGDRYRVLFKMFGTVDTHIDVTRMELERVAA